MKAKKKLYICRLALLLDGSSEYLPSVDSDCILDLNMKEGCMHLTPHEFDSIDGQCLCKGWCSGLGDVGLKEKKCSSSCAEVPDGGM